MVGGWWVLLRNGFIIRNKKLVLCSQQASGENYGRHSVSSHLKKIKSGRIKSRYAPIFFFLPQWGGWVVLNDCDW